MSDQDKRIGKFTLIIIAYPIVLIAISLGVNVLGFGVRAPVLALPSQGLLVALAVSGILLLINHSWLMTATELTRLRHSMYATHEEWVQNGVRKEDVDERGWIELERHHNAHRNATENTIYFVCLAPLVCLTTPPTLLAQIWLITFAFARLGYTLGALRPMGGLRQLSMSVSLLALYGLASYLAVSLLA